jgi:hypothetical protein
VNPIEPISVCQSAIPCPVAPWAITEDDKLLTLFEVQQAREEHFKIDKRLKRHETMTKLGRVERNDDTTATPHRN